ncbi:MAG: hypothetical protein ACTSVO_00775 [Candidatus Heimdallarchaeaceae archaeon]
MSKLRLPSKTSKRQQAFERIIAQFLFKLKLKFPKHITDKRIFLSLIISEYIKQQLPTRFPCRWGVIRKPVTFLEELGDDAWSLAGVKDFLKFYHKRREVNRAHNRRRAEKWFKGAKTPSKSETWEIGKNIERDLNEYGKKWDIECYVDEIVAWSAEGFTIKIIIGPFTEIFSWSGTKEELLAYLKELVKDCLNHPEEMKEYREEMKDIREEIEIE